MSVLNNVLCGIGVTFTAVIAIGCGPTTNQPAGMAPPPPPTARVGSNKTYDYTHSLQVDPKKRLGQSWSVAILRFGDTRVVENVPFGPEPAKEATVTGGVNVKVAVGTQPVPSRPTQSTPAITKRSRDFLKHALVTSKAFTVVERERILEILREINFSKTPHVDPSTSPESGKLYSVRYLIEGSLGRNEDKTLKDTIDAKKNYSDISQSDRGFASNIFKSTATRREERLAALAEMQKRRFKEKQQQTFSTACYLSAYDVRTGQVKVSVMGLGTNDLEAINDAVEVLIEELAEKDDGIRVAAVSGDTVYFDIGSKGGIKAGDSFQIIQKDKEILNQHGQVIGHAETVVGKVRVSEVKEQMSIAKVLTKSGNIARGNIATTVPVSK
ncbi:MAG: hypothetical protein HN909_08680 [Phycisphaerales bacterium]|jgi:hypothetical protein|nr:hypothetical protein [Phycisphaerales bacterium]MBT7171828.1 hypothetical protein [Phycisphaerales bacterium]